ncbi:MAG: primosomal protein N' [Bacteroidota bacterium]
MGSLADVALPLAVDKIFTYRIPPELQQAAAAGMRVVVPFGTKHATGLIVGLPEQSPRGGLKPLMDIIDGRPILSPDLLQLCHWIARYYYAPLGEVLKAAVPHGFATPSKQVAMLSSPLEEEAMAEIERRSPQRALVLRLLQKHERLTPGQLSKRTGLKSINALLQQMVKDGLLLVQDVLTTQRRRGGKARYLLLGETDDARLASALISMSPRRKKAQLLLSSVVALKNEGVKEIEAKQFLKEHGHSPALLKQLAAEGIIPLREEEIPTIYATPEVEPPVPVTLNAHQVQALEAIARTLDTRDAGTHLLHGVTGSGKTQVYIEAIRHCLDLNRSAIVLVPEISLTPQTVRRFQSHFGDRVRVVHSKMSAGERQSAWRAVLSESCSIVIGPRSAVFAPFPDLGLIVVDEEHEAAYKQFDASPRYHARDVAVMRGQLSRATVVLGSATPSLESYANATAGKYNLVEMPNRIKDVMMPDITIVDMTEERKRAYAALKELLPADKRARLKEFQQPVLSNLLHDRIQDRLNKREGIILLQNRRGFAPFVSCPDCGYAEACEHCSVTLTYHMPKQQLRCHYCGLVRPPHTECPQCNGTHLRLHGTGTQRVEEELHRATPDARVVRMDLDTTSRKGAHERILQLFARREADILLGTQMVAKGLDFPHVTLVGVISADTQMLLPDFRSAERTFQLLTQVAGRSGRSSLRGEVIIQTHQPNHPTLRHVACHDYGGFFQEELESRRELEYPPFSRLLLIETKGADEEKVRATAERIGSLLKSANGTFTVLGPAPAVIGRVKQQYRWHTIVKNSRDADPGGVRLRKAMEGVLEAHRKSQHRSVRVIIDADPVGLL